MCFIVFIMGFLKVVLIVVLLRLISSKVVVVVVFKMEHLDVRRINASTKKTVRTSKQTLPIRLLPF